MLDPAARLIYLNELQPPPGYRLDRAVATTFSLDLMSLLMAPLSMAMLDARRDSEGRLDPIGALEALRRTADKFVVFCQKGRIAVPAQHQLLYGCLEPAVIETVAPNGGSFHPKTWLLRFEPDDKQAPVRYRFLCLSRNLTFDRSWDTALALDGELMDRQNAYGRNHPLNKFILSLPGMAAETLSVKAKEHVTLLADEVLRVQFTVPDDFQDVKNSDDLIFLPRGIDGRRRSFLGTCNRLLIVSPFLSDGWLQSGVREWFPRERTTLVSRADSLDALHGDTYQTLLAAGAKLFAMTEMAEMSEGDEEGRLEDVPVAERRSGLHAKLYALDQGRLGVRLWTGSANASEAAFSGANVEFMVGLRWPVKRNAIEALLGAAQPEDNARHNGAATLADLLVPYERVDHEEDAGLVTRRRLEEDLDAARKSICLANLTLTAGAEAAGHWDLRFQLAGGVALPESVRCRCLPVSLGEQDACDLSGVIKNREYVFRCVPTHGLTRFIGFSIVAQAEGETVKTSFVLKLSATGFPEDRDGHILRAIVQNREGFLRILMLILMDDEASPVVLAKTGEPGTAGNMSFIEAFGIPLFEELVQASSRHPDKIARISELLEELACHGNSPDIVPADFKELWKVFSEYGAMRNGDDGNG